ncbi:hypothetical protein [Methylobacterium soli]|uniref:Uncharacterized protein n=1 Tax=Methylobacterium soli TaxID=553447 RepID=A0A6L3SPX3_9HYPH|nr:hypothetical protein [Methylobacterium soli]KAB1072236.1 hypothetical protein F6X53_28440 [Methylobacterium soli]
MNLLSDEELLEHCRRLYREHGPIALTYTFLKAQKGLYAVLYGRGITQKDLAARLGVAEELREHIASRPMVRAGQTLTRRSWPQLIAEAREVADRHGSLPPAQWFQQNGRGSLVQYVYVLGRTWDELREAIGDRASGAFVQSRNGLRWRSHPEASLSNFLFARGIEHRRGDRYPKEYEALSGKAHGRYDMHFASSKGWIDVEIWGDDPGGHGAANYRTVRALKEQFNADNPRFLGIHFERCFSEEALSGLLKPYVDTIAPFRFERASDPLIPTTHWSNTDELLEYSRRLAADMPDGEFPTEEWLRKRGKWADRPGPAYNTLSIYITKWFGGVRALRRLLGQAHVSTNQWDREKVLVAWRAFYEAHGRTPNQVRAHHARGIATFSPEVVHQAERLTNAVVKYAGGATIANAAVGITVDRKRKPRSASQ